MARIPSSKETLPTGLNRNCWKPLALRPLASSKADVFPTDWVKSELLETVYGAGAKARLRTTTPYRLG